MDQPLRPLFDRALIDEPEPLSDDLAGRAITAGTGLRRRRQRWMAAGAAAVTAVAGLGLVNLPAAGPHHSAPPETVQAGFDSRMNPTCHLPAPDAATDLSVFLTFDIGDRQRHAIESTLRADPAVAAVLFETREEAYVKFRKRYADNPDLVAAVTPDQLPEAFRAKLVRPTNPTDLLARLRRMPGVDQAIPRICPDGVDVWSVN